MRLLKIGRTKEQQAFIAIFVIGLLVSLVLTIKNGVINSRYQEPKWSNLYVIWIEYVLFAFVAPVFLKSWKVKGRFRLVRVVIAALLFVFSYLFVLTAIDWWVNDGSFSLWLAFEFTVLHSGAQVLVVYGLIGTALVLLGVGETPMAYLQKLKLRDQDRNYVLDVDELVFMESNDNYVNLVTNDGKKHLLRITLSSLESQLDPSVFQRIHRRCIVKLASIDFWKADANGGYLVTMKDRTTLKMSRSFKDKIDEFVKR